jgi:hypothetical protein
VTPRWHHPRPKERKIRMRREKRGRERRERKERRNKKILKGKYFGDLKK